MIIISYGSNYKFDELSLIQIIIVIYEAFLSNRIKLHTIV